MNLLARKAVLCIGPVALGCAQVPKAPDYSVEVSQRGAWTMPGDATVPPPAAPTLSGEHARAAAPQDPPGKLLPSLPPPRPVEAADAPVVPGVTQVPAGDGQSLTDLEDLADRVNPSLRRDLALIEAARGQAVQAGLFPNPRFDTNNPQVLNGRQTLLNAGVQMEIPVAGKKRLDQSAANEATRQAEITYAQNRAGLHAAIRQQFFAVLVDQERVRVLKLLSDLARQSYEAGTVKQKAGDATEIDTKLLLVAFQQSQATARSAEAILDGDRRQLEAIIGSPGIIRGPLKGPLKGPYPEFDDRELIAYVTRNHTQIGYALSVLRQHRVLLRRAEVEVYPNPYMGPAYQFGLVPGSDQFWFNIQFGIPVWDRNQGNIRAAKANMTVAAESVDVSRLNLVNQAENSISQYRAARAVVERYESGVLENANEAARLVRVGYVRGITDLPTFLQAQQAAAQANSAYVDALQNLWLNAAQLSGLLQLERFLTPSGASNISVPPPGPQGRP